MPMPLNEPTAVMGFPSSPCKQFAALKADTLLCSNSRVRPQRRLTRRFCLETRVHPVVAHAQQLLMIIDIKRCVARVVVLVFLFVASRIPSRYWTRHSSQDGGPQPPPDNFPSTLHTDSYAAAIIMKPIIAYPGHHAVVQRTHP
eukprot:scaffold3666_cov315-Pinguiococcus_pyrenoidosus.AAC.1